MPPVGSISTTFVMSFEYSIERLYDLNNMKIKIKQKISIVVDYRIAQSFNHFVNYWIVEKSWLGVAINQYICMVLGK